MTGRETSLEFVRAFCAGDLERLAAVLAEDLRFAGPFLRCESRAEYLGALAQDPPPAADFEVLKVAEDGDQVALLWEYRKPDGPLLIAQWNRLRGDRISEVVLVFDSGSRG